MQSLLQHFDTIGSTLDIGDKAQFARVCLSPRRHPVASRGIEFRRRLGGVVWLPVKVNPRALKFWLKANSQPRLCRISTQFQHIDTDFVTNIEEKRFW